MSQLELEVISTGDDTIAVINGDIDLSNADQLHADIAQGVPRTATSLTIDLSGVGYIDSQGARMIYELAQQHGSAGSPVTVVAPDGSFAADLLRYTPIPNTTITGEES